MPRTIRRNSSKNNKKTKKTQKRFLKGGSTNNNSKALEKDGNLFLSIATSDIFKTPESKNSLQTKKFSLMADIEYNNKEGFFEITIRNFVKTAMGENPSGNEAAGYLQVNPSQGGLTANEKAGYIQVEPGNSQSSQGNLEPGTGE